MGYLDSVQARYAEVEAQRKAAREAEAQQKNGRWADRLTPLEDRLSKLLETIPTAIIENGLSLEALRRLLSGKWRGNCHPGELGAAMRKLGFTRHRNWSNTDGAFRAKWFKEKQQ